MGLVVSSGFSAIKIKIKARKLRCRLRRFLFGALKVNSNVSIPLMSMRVGCFYKSPVGRSCISFRQEPCGAGYVM